MSKTRKMIGLLLGTDICWPQAYEEIMHRHYQHITVGGTAIELPTERITIEPFRLGYQPKYDLVIDRLQHWYIIAREWLKKSAIMNDVYILNNPWTFQSFEKHTAFCAMLRLGLKIPETWLIPQKDYPKESAAYTYTTEHYNRFFSLPDIAASIGYPLYMKPYDGGGWRGVTKIDDVETLMKSYDDSGMQNMHLQKAVDPFDAFVRSLTIGPDCLPMHYDPEQPLHARYLTDEAKDFLTPTKIREVTAISKTINAFFRWEFNSCEGLYKGEEFHPIDYANACPDSSISSLHVHFPWVIKSLVRWTIFSAVTERKLKIELNLQDYWDIAAREDLGYYDKLWEYEKLADKYFETEKFRDFCDVHFKDLDEQMLTFMQSDSWRKIQREKIERMFPEHEWDMFTEHYDALIAEYVKRESARIGKA